MSSAAFKPSPKLRRFFYALLAVLFFLAVGFIINGAWPLRTITTITGGPSDFGHLWSIGQARFMAEINKEQKLPPEALLDVYAYAAYLAQTGVVTDPKMWNSFTDPIAREYQWPEQIINPAPKPKIDPRFQGAPLAVAVALLPGVLQLPGTTPIVWTRGLQPDGTWRKDSPYGGAVGGIYFANGSLEKFSRIDGKLKTWDTGKPTSNIHEALPPGTRIGEYLPTPEASRRAEKLRQQEAKREALEEFSSRFFSASRKLISLLLLMECGLLATFRLNERNYSGLRVLGMIGGLVFSVWFWAEVFPFVREMVG